MRIGVSLPAGTFMPEYKKQEENHDPPESLLRGYDTAKRIGYDYIEASAGALHALSDEAFERLVQLTHEGQFRLEVCNSFIPPHIPLCTAPAETIRDYVDRTFRRLQALSVHTVIFGSGYARRYPPQMQSCEAMEKMESFLRFCDQLGGTYGVITAIEPLNSTETNVFTSVRQAASFIRSSGLPNIRLLPDLFHMAMEQEDPRILTDCRDLIVHLHASEAPGRVYPGKFGGAYLKQCGMVLRESAMDTDITVECVFENFETEAAQSLEFVKENLQWALRS